MKLKQSLLLVFFLMCLTLSLKSQTDQLDSLENILKTSVETESLILANIEIGAQYSQLRQDTALHYLNNAIDLSLSISNQELLADAYSGLSYYHGIVKEENEKAFLMASKSVELITNLGDTSKKYMDYAGNAKFFEGKFLADQGRFTDAHASFLDAIRAFEKTDNGRSILLVNNQLLILFSQQDQLDKAEEILNNSIAISLKNNWYYDQMIFQSNKGGLLNYLEKFEESIESYRVAEKLIYSHLDTADYYSLGLIYTNIGSNYLTLEVFDSSFIYLSKGLSYREKINNPPSIITSHSYLCLNCADLGNFDQAKRHCESMQLGLDTLEMEELEIRGLDAWIHFYEATGNYKGALEKTRELFDINDERRSADNVREQTEQQKDFEFEKERLLNEKELELKNENIATERSYNKNLTWGIIILAGLLLGFVFLFYSNFKKQRIISRQNVKLNNSVAEKEMLIKEIHHRVKNNLQLVSSLLSLQSDSIENEEVTSVFEEGQNRVGAMALIHQKLYQNDTASDIDFQDYLSSLVQHFNEANAGEKEAVINVDCQGVRLDIDTAIPLGLIVNELFTNSFKHAFSNVDSPELSVSIKSEGNGDYILKMTDNGDGLPPDLDWAKTKTLGLRLIRNLVKQLIGKIDYTHQADLSVFSIRFKNQLGRNLLD